jgi:uncharacterized membrane protein YgcG
MKRLLLLLAVLLPALSLQARDQKVRDVDIKLTLAHNGDAVILERWDVDTGDKITEWYLVRENLGDIEINRFMVYDEKGKLQDDGEWDVDRTREEKAGRYGIVHKSNGVELCWGVGEYGDRVFQALYVMTRSVKTLNDYDMLHLQVVSPGLAAPPEHVHIRVVANEQQLDTTNTRIWGFGFDGTSAFEEDGSVVFESSHAFDTEDSAIILLRFNKGLFTSPSVQERDFQEVLDKAMEGADFGDKKEEDDPVTNGIAAFFTALIMYFAFLRPIVRFFRKDVFGKAVDLGFRPKKAPWWREIPLKGNLRMANYILSGSGNAPPDGGLPLAIILRLIHKGCIRVTRDVEGPAVLSFTDQNLSELDGTSRELYKMLRLSAGDDKLLQDKEFSKWAKTFSKPVYEWSSNALKEGIDDLQRAGWYKLSKGTLTPAGKTEALHLFGLKNFLSDFTLLNQREAFEANLWKEYMVYGALFGITDKVIKQLKDIDPSLFKQVFPYEVQDLSSVMATSQMLSGIVRDAIKLGTPAPVYSSGSGGSSSSGGYGGSTSRGGGGGYSGGGRGGGGR